MNIINLGKPTLKRNSFDLFFVHQGALLSWILFFLCVYVLFELCATFVFIEVLFTTFFVIKKYLGQSIRIK